MYQIRPQLIETGSWTLSAQIIRRHPHLRIYEMHPGGGQYDCLAFVDSTNAEILGMYNRVGRFHPFKDNAPQIERAWSVNEALVSNEELKDIADRLERDMGLPRSGKAKETSRHLLVYRAIAAFLSHASFSRQQWSARSGFLDTSGYPGGVVDEFFEAVSGAKRKYDERIEELRQAGRSTHEVFAHPAYEFWFLVTANGARAALHIDGEFWIDGVGGSLSKIFHASGRKLYYTVVQAFGSVME